MNPFHEVNQNTLPDDSSDSSASSLFETMKSPQGADEVARTTSGTKGSSRPAKIDSLLFCLNKAACYMDRGDINKAVWALDDIPCDTFLRSKCDPWIAESKHAMIGKTTLQAMRARMDCLRQMYRT